MEEGHEPLTPRSDGNVVVVANGVASSGAAGQMTSTKNTTVFHPRLQTEFDEQFLYTRPKKAGLRKRAKKAAGANLKPRPCFRRLLGLFPALIWLPRYKRTDFIPDVVSGFTVAVMHIPQGMAYALLAGVPPIVGLYMAFFPVLLYVLMGTSRHISMGSFAVVCMMTSKVVLRFSLPPDVGGVAANETDDIAGFGVAAGEEAVTYTPIEVATALALVAGAWQVLLGVMRLGTLSVFMSDTLVSGFTTAAAVHVMSSQIRNLLGLTGMPVRNGALKLIYMWIDMARALPQTNLVALAVSVAFIAALSLYNELLKPRWAKRFAFPLPVELAAVVVGTLLSYLLELGPKHGVTTLGVIPTGLPPPSVPPLELAPHLLVDGLLIAIIAFSVNMSMASIFARKLRYSIDANQELLASGFSNMLGAFFSCVAVAASLSRSLIQHAVGGRTQVASLVSCTALLLVLLVLGPQFEPLPNCVLASIVVVALKGMLVQVCDFPSIWRKSRSDGIVWLCTFLSVILIDIDYGLFIGIALSLTSVIIMGQKPKMVRLGHVPGTDIYLDLNRYHAAMEVKGICIIHIAGGLHFANKDYFYKKLQHLLCDHEKAFSLQVEMVQIISQNDKKVEAQEHENASSQLLNHQSSPQAHVVILDMSSVCFVDPSSLKGLESLYEELQSKQINLCLAECSAQVYERMVNCDFFWKFPDSQLFASVHDAALFALQLGAPAASTDDAA